MLLKLVDLFAFLSVVLRAGTLVFQSLLLGGVLFVLWVARSSPAGRAGEHCKNPEVVVEAAASQRGRPGHRAVALPLCELSCADGDGGDRVRRRCRRELLYLGLYRADGRPDDGGRRQRQQEHREVGAAGTGGRGDGRVGDDESRCLAPHRTPAADHAVERP